VRHLSRKKRPTKNENRGTKISPKNWNKNVIAKKAMFGDLLAFGSINVRN
jgi:hypothetical protein